MTMNEGAQCDVYVCQKVRPFASLRAKREAGALVVYDFDDHLLLEGVESHGVREEVVAFMNAADVVTVGSEYLGVDARNFHGNVFVLENPVDIESDKLVREQKAELKRVGWFGTPAGLIDLRAVKTSEPIETITRGGDIEFDLKSIDRTLTAFDLMLLPVEPNRWNLAKNANRMAKAVALGVPVLATATPAHIATAEQLGLDDRFLVNQSESWDDKIAGLRRDFSAVQEAILRARGRALELFSLQRIGGDWLQDIERALNAKAAAAGRSTSTDEALNDVALVTLAYRMTEPPSSTERAGLRVPRQPPPRRGARCIERLFRAVRETGEDGRVGRARVDPVQAAGLSPNTRLPRRGQAGLAAGAARPILRGAEPGARLSRR